MNTPTNNESKKYYDYTGKGNVDLEAQNQNMNDSWTEEFISRFFVSRLNDNSGKAPHVGAQHDAVTYISSLLESARSDERKKVLRDMRDNLRVIATSNESYEFGKVVKPLLVRAIEDYAKQSEIDLSE